MRALIELTDNPDGTMHVDANVYRTGTNDHELTSPSSQAYDIVTALLRLLGSEHSEPLRELIATLSEEGIESVEVEYGIPRDTSH